MSYTFHYGTYDHPNCEVYPKRIEVRPVRTRDNARWAMHYRMEVAGDLVGHATPAEVTAEIALMDAAYANDNLDAGFKLNNVWTPHYLNSSSALNLTGNRVVYRSWDNVLPTELANTRSFSVGIEAVFALGNTGLIEFNEVTTKIGNGGPKWRLYNTWAGDPVKEQICSKSLVKHVTRGRYVSIEPWLAPPAPYWPLEEQQWLRVVQYSSPIWHGHPSGKYTHYAVDYAYTFERLGPDATTPFNTWFT
jgi:hypothetical protein